MPIFKSLALTLALLATAVFADQVVLKEGHPDRHVVVKGDTLWDISEQFLDSPWLWPEIWYVNPQIENPHLIYPGDIISLVYVDGKPQLRVQRGKGVFKLSPQARSERLDKAIPTIPVDAIQQFLTQPLVVDEDTLKDAAYVVSSADEHLIVGAGDRAYVRGIDASQGSRYHVFRPGDAYIDPDSGEILGYEALYLGDGDAQKFGDPSTLKLVRTNREINIGDRYTKLAADVQSHSNAPSVAITRLIGGGLADESIDVRMEVLQLLLQGQDPEELVKTLVANVKLADKEWRWQHDELVNSRGMYYQLVQKQMASM